MISFPNCKINLGLNITERRSDGFHNLETMFYPLNLSDVPMTVMTRGEAFIKQGGSKKDINEMWKLKKESLNEEKK